LKKFETAPTEYLGARGTMIHEKNLKSKISCQTTFNSFKIEALTIHGDFRACSWFQGMGYAMLAGVDPVVGIYTAFFPVLVYVFMGTMPHVSMGTFAVVSILASKAVVS
jgi:hypothetical protein